MQTVRCKYCKQFVYQQYSKDKKKPYYTNSEKGWDFHNCRPKKKSKKKELKIEKGTIRLGYDHK